MFFNRLKLSDERCGALETRVIVARLSFCFADHRLWFAIDDGRKSVCYRNFFI